MQFHITKISFSRRERASFFHVKEITTRSSMIENFSKTFCDVENNARDWNDFSLNWSFKLKIESRTEKTARNSEALARITRAPSYNKIIWTLQYSRNNVISRFCTISRTHSYFTNLPPRLHFFFFLSFYQNAAETRTFVEAILVVVVQDTLQRVARNI